MNKKNLYIPAVIREIQQRIDQLKPHSNPEWGKMSVSQMLMHAAQVLQVYTGERPLEIPFFARLFKRKIWNIVFGDKPYRRNTPTLQEFKVSGEPEFHQAKTALLTALNNFISQAKMDAELWVHPLFGKTSLEDRGWAMYKHLDHHLRQFGV